MLAWFLLDNKVNNYENYRSKPYKEAESGVGVYIALRLALLYANQKPDRVMQSGWISLQINCRKVFMFGTQSQTLRYEIACGRNRGIFQQTRIGMQSSHGLHRHTGYNRCNQKRQTERHKSKERSITELIVANL